MQVIRYFSGNKTFEDSEARPLIYGGKNQTTGKYVWRTDPSTGSRIRVFVSESADITNFLSETIVGFLKSCGVDAEWREDDDGVKWAYIENIPFLFVSSGNKITVYHPCVANESASYSKVCDNDVGYWFETDKDTNVFTYDFGLVFSGKAGHGWCLRFKCYGNSSAYKRHALPRVSSFLFCYYTAKHIPTGNPGAIVTGGATSAYYIGARRGNVTAIQVSGGKVVESSVFVARVSGADPRTYLSVQAGGNEANWNICDDKIPLIPITCGLYQAVGCYKHIKGLHIPDATDAKTEAQTEVFVGSKILMNTCYDDARKSCINMGLIDVT